MQYGKGYYRDKLGVDVTTGWLLDTFGHHAQMPQLLTLGGLQDVLVLPRRAPARLPLGVLLGGDRRHADPRLLAAPGLRASSIPRPKDPATFRKAAEGAIQRPDAQQPGCGRSRRACRAPTSPSRRSTWSRRSRRSTRTPRPPFTIKMAVPADFEAVVARRDRSDRLQGRAQPDLPGDLQQPDRAEERGCGRSSGSCSRPRSSARWRPGWARPPIRRRSWPPGSPCSSTRPTTWPRAS